MSAKWTFLCCLKTEVCNGLKTGRVCVVTERVYVVTELEITCLDFLGSLCVFCFVLHQ